MSSESSNAQIIALEPIRQRLSQITQSLAHLQHVLLSGRPLPPWTTVQSNFNILLSQLINLSEAIKLHEAQLRAIVVYPGPTFPVQNQEALLTTLLRTKPLPEVEEWELHSKALGNSLEPTQTITFAADQTGPDGGLFGNQPEQLSVIEWFEQRKSERNWTGFLTKSEQDADMEIDRDDLDDIRKQRVEEQHLAMSGMNAMLKFMRTGQI